MANSAAVSKKRALRESPLATSDRVLICQPDQLTQQPVGELWILRNLVRRRAHQSAQEAGWVCEEGLYQTSDGDPNVSPVSSKTTVECRGAGDVLSRDHRAVLGGKDGLRRPQVLREGELGARDFARAEPEEVR